MIWLMIAIAIYITTGILFALSVDGDGWTSEDLFDWGWVIACWPVFVIILWIAREKN